MGKWYQANIHDYNQGAYSMCTVVNAGRVRHDCSGFVSACLRAAGIIGSGVIYSSRDFLAGGRASSALRKAGFVSMRYSLSSVRPYDIIAYNGHVEIYAGRINGSDRSWAWGSVHDGLNGHTGEPCYTASKSRYVVMWRQGGNAANIADPYVGGINEFDGGLSNADVTNNYETFNSNINPAVFTSAMKNSYTPTTTHVVSADSAGGHRTRIYSASKATISVDELSMPMNEPESKIDTTDSQKEAKATKKATGRVKTA